MDRIYHSGISMSKKEMVHGFPFRESGISSNVGWVELGATHQKQLLSDGLCFTSPILRLSALGKRIKKGSLPTKGALFVFYRSCQEIL